MKNLLGIFKIRKVILAGADLFFVGVSALIANFLLSFRSHGVDESTLVILIAVSSMCCIGGLIIAGAYSKLWRYFNGKDYLSCVYGVIIGIAASSAIVYIIDNSFYISYRIICYIRIR